jgi:hypothetical protein
VRILPRNYTEDYCGPNLTVIKLFRVRAGGKLDLLRSLPKNELFIR